MEKAAAVEEEPAAAEEPALVGQMVRQGSTGRADRPAQDTPAHMWESGTGLRCGLLDRLLDRFPW